MSAPLDSRYNPKEIEAKGYSLWESKGYFHPKSGGPRFAALRTQTDKRPYVIVIPPPMSQVFCTWGTPSITPSRIFLSAGIV